LFNYFVGKNNFSKEEIALLVADLDKDKSGKIEIKGKFSEIFHCYYNFFLLIEFLALFKM
jgi:hypothetical protein